MAWTKLPTNYQDAVWNGNRKYRMISNYDGTVSFEDVTEYSQKEYSFFGANDANAMNAGMNELAENMETVATYAQLAKTSADTATTKATKAADSATAAANSQTKAANSASIATSKATEAANSQTKAANSATEAAVSAMEAQNSADVAKTILYTGAGAHNAIYRGKNLGTSVTKEQYAAIAAGTFDDMYIGDYWVINDMNWRIAAFDYYLTTGDTACRIHHVTIVPDANLDLQPMNSSDTTSGGYLGSDMYRANMATAKNKVIAAFGSAHILTHRLYLDNTVRNGYPSARAWVDSQIELMSEQNVYGGKLYHGVTCGTNVPSLTEVDKSQYPLFAHDPHMISNRQTYWLRNVVSGTSFAYVYAYGRADAYYASDNLGVRPAFSIKF